MLSYRRITIQCTEAQRQFKASNISPDVAREVSRLARLLLTSVDLHYWYPVGRGMAPARLEQRSRARKALRGLRNAIR